MLSLIKNKEWVAHQQVNKLVSLLKKLEEISDPIYHTGNLLRELDRIDFEMTERELLKTSGDDKIRYAIGEVNALRSALRSSIPYDRSPRVQKQAREILSFLEQHFQV